MNFLGIGGSLRASNNFIDFKSKCCTKGLHHKNSITGRNTHDSIEEISISNGHIACQNPLRLSI
jgi:hypothetical protein